MKNFLLLLAVALLSVLGLLAFLAGASLMISPSGSGLGLSSDWLSATPFNDYQVLGAVLLFTVGLPSLLIAAYTVQKKKYYPTFILIQGVVFILWIVIQMMISSQLLNALVLGTSFAVGGILVIISILLIRLNRLRL